MRSRDAREMGSMVEQTEPLDVCNTRYVWVARRGGSLLREEVMSNAGTTVSAAVGGSRCKVKEEAQKEQEICGRSCKSTSHTFFLSWPNSQPAPPAPGRGEKREVGEEIEEAKEAL